MTANQLQIDLQPSREETGILIFGDSFAANVVSASAPSLLAAVTLSGATVEPAQTQR